ncbi:MAG: hypothetical protein ACNYZG_04450 [Gammaproteobacteria bacterium]
MAFGGGALLAALTIDLAGSAVEQGNFNALAISTIIGGLMFIGLNRIVNDYGGFLRKVSTTVYYLRRKQHQRLKRIARQLNRVNLFENLPNQDFSLLAALIRNIDIRLCNWIYTEGDPSEFLYIVIDGDVELVNSRDRTQTPELGY